MQSKVFAVSFFILFSLTLVSCSVIKGYFSDEKIVADVEKLEKDSEDYIEKDISPTETK